MFIVIGATGHVGTSVTHQLLRARAPVTVVTRSAEKARAWERLGAQSAVVELDDVEGLRAVFRKGTRAFLLNPPGDIAANAEQEELNRVESLTQALEGTELEFIVALSTIGAQQGSNIGDLGTLFDLEEHLWRQRIRTAVLRAAYYFTNWDMTVASARETGKLESFFPADFELPMVSPNDIGVAAASLLQLQDLPPHGSTFSIEGPRRYRPLDVAAALGSVVGREIQVAATKDEELESTFESLGFSPESARSFTGMTRLSEAEEPPRIYETLHGKTTLEEHFARVVRVADAQAEESRSSTTETSQGL